jgi:serine phosphatase RsbU (regulator of sigma subunit)
MHLFHTQAPAMSLEQWCQQFSREMEERAPAAMLASAICCRLDPRTGRGGWVNAGHPPPVLYRDGTGPTLLESYGLLLGVSADATYTLNELMLEPGDILFLYTDGVTEAVRSDGSLTGIEPMLDRLPALTALPAPEIAAALEAHLAEIATPRDDLTLVVIRRSSTGGSR